MTQAQTAPEITSIQTVGPPVVDTALAFVQAEEKKFELAQRKAAIYSKSTLVPKEYQNNIGNVLIAENMAHRMGADTLMVMQNLYIVHGKPGWSAVFLIGTFNSNGRFTAIKYRFKGEPNTDDWGCQAYCTEIATGEEIEGTWITWKIANSEGWVSKAGSKWRTIPEQMFRYRAATFLIRATAPEIGLGLLTKEELEDMPYQNGDAAPSPVAGIDGIKGRLGLAAATTEEPEVLDAEPVFNEPSTEQPKADSGLEQPAEASTTSAAPSKEESEELSPSDQTAKAFEIYRSLEGEQKLKADKFLKTKGIAELGPDKLADFINIFGETIAAAE